MIRFRSYRRKLQTALVLLGVAALAVAGWQASAAATSALRTATYNRLTAVRETRARQIERYFHDLGNHVLALSSDESTVTALESFAPAIASLPKMTTSALRREYQSMFQDLENREPGVRQRIDEWFPGNDPVALALQHWFLARNPYPPGGRFRVLAVPETGPYGDIHARFHPTFHRYLSAFGFYDIFLISPSDGRLLYTVMKEIDIGTKLGDEPYRQTTLARAWRRAMALPEPETFVVEDYAPYLPSSLAPAAFVAAPVFRAGNKTGVLAIQLSIAEINRIMTGEGRWAEEGLGSTGQAYLIGNDGTLRSDVRHELEEPEQFYKELEEAGNPAEVIDRIRRYRTAVLSLNVKPADVQEGTGPGTDFRGVPVLRSEAPLSLAGLTWRVVAEIETQEAFAPVSELRWRMLWQALLLALAFMAAASLLARNVTNPLLRLAASARRLGQRDFGVRLPVESADEIGQLAQSFNSMAEELERTTVSKQELDRMLGSLINAVFVVDAHPEAAAIELLDAPLREMNRAGHDLLGNITQDTRLRTLIPPEREDQWHDRLSRLARSGRLPPEEATLLGASGNRIPILFSASRLAEEHGRASGYVCVAQDISEWKIAQDKLRRMSKVFMDATDPIVVADATGRVVDCNVEAVQTYGWHPDELEGKSLETFFGDPQQIAALLQRCVAGEAIRNVETVQIDRTRREFPALLTLSLLTGEHGPAGVAAISKDITERKLAEESLRQKQAELEELTGRLITAQEEERARLSRELHDNLTQRLAAVAIEAGRLERIPVEQADRWRFMLERIKKQMAGLSTEVHDLSRRLHPSTLDDLGLSAAIESECRSFFERSGTPVDYSTNGHLPALPKETSLGLYRIVQEALWNISKHAGANEVRIDLRRQNGYVRLTIADDGQGFDRSAPGWRAGIGLASMEERTRLFRGTFAISSEPGRGTMIEVTAPAGDENVKAEDIARG